MFLGYNPQIKAGKLHLEAMEWFVPIKKEAPALQISISRVKTEQKARYYEGTNSNSCDHSYTMAERARFELAVPLRILRFSRPAHLTTLAPLPLFFKISGEGGIRTLGNLTATHALQACRLNRSRTSP